LEGKVKDMTVIGAHFESQGSQLATGNPTRMYSSPNSTSALAIQV